jgi:hypothetical protein
MKVRIIEKLMAIERAAEIMKEHHQARGFKNNIISLGVETIITLTKEAIEEVSKEEQEG